MFMHPLYLSPGTKLSIIVAASLSLFATTSVLAREPLSDAQIREVIIQQSISQYQATGHPCACPHNLARNGSRCPVRR
jgi:hypothetical protein